MTKTIAETELKVYSEDGSKKYQNQMSSWTRQSGKVRQQWNSAINTRNL